MKKVLIGMVGLAVLVVPVLASALTVASSTAIVDGAITDAGDNLTAILPISVEFAITIGVLFLILGAVFGYLFRRKR